MRGADVSNPQIAGPSIVRNGASSARRVVHRALSTSGGHPDRVGRPVAGGVPARLAKVARLGLGLNKRTEGALAFFDHPDTSNGPTEAINGRLERLRGIALSFRNLTRYIARSLLEAGGFRRQLHR